MAAHTRQRALITFAVRLTSAAIAYVLQVALARIMGTAQFGVFAYVWTWVLLLGSFTCLGFNESVRRFLPQYMTAKDFPRARGFITAMYSMTIGFSLFAAGLGALLVYAIGNTLTGIFTIPALLAMICLPLYTLLDTQGGEAMSRSWVLKSLLPPYILRPLATLGFMYAAIRFGLPATAATAMQCAIAAMVFAVIIQTIMVRRALARQLPRTGKKTFATGKWLVVSLPLVAVEGFYALATNMDMLVLGAFVAPDQIAIYYASLKTMALVAFVHFAMAQVSARRFAEFAGNKEALARFYAGTIRWTFWPSLAAVVLMTALGKPFLAMFGPQFAGAYPVILIFAASLVFQASAGPVMQLMNMTGRERVTLKASAAGLCVNLVLNLALIPWLGLIGAAIATGLGTALQTVILAHQAKRLTGTGFFFLNGREAT